MLDTRFPRPPGDIGNPATFPFPVDYRVVPKASVARVVRRDGPPADLTDAFLPAARELAAGGAGLITTSCGFLSAIEDRIASAVACPVVASALSLLPGLRRNLGEDAAIGVITFDSRELGAAHLPSGSGDVIIEGIETGRELHRVIAGDMAELDVDRAREDAEAAAIRLRAEASDLQAVVLECTNLAPYRNAIATAVGCPVLDIRDAITARLPSA